MPGGGTVGVSPAAGQPFFQLGIIKMRRHQMSSHGQGLMILSHRAFLILSLTVILGKVVGEEKEEEIS